MANPEHLNILKQGVEIWNQWRKENPDITPDLSNVDLSGIHSIGTALPRADLKGVDLSGANLTGINLILVNLSNANLRGAYLKYADLKYANLKYADLTGANLTRANLKGADLTDTDLTDTDLTDTDLTNTNLESAKGIKAGLLNNIGLLNNMIASSNTSQDSVDSKIFAFELKLSSEMQTMQKNLEKKIEQVKNPFDNNEIKQQIENKISEKLDNIISQEVVQKVGKDVRQLTADFSIKQDICGIVKNAYDTSSSRYKVYADKSEKEATLYRYVGIGFCVAGVIIPIVILCVILYGQYPNYENWHKIFMGVPITFTLEALGLILLTLSQKATERMRAFSVETCNLDLQSSGYLSLVQSANMPHIATSMEMLAKSERHYILKKDERTIEENQNKSHLEFMKSVTDIIKPIINNKS